MNEIKLVVGGHKTHHKNNIVLASKIIYVLYTRMARFAIQPVSLCWTPSLILHDAWMLHCKVYMNCYIEHYNLLQYSLLGNQIQTVYKNLQINYIRREA